MTKVSDLIEKRRKLKGELERVEYDLKQVNKELFELVAKADDEKISADDEEYRIVRGYSTRYNWKGIEEALGDKYSLVLKPDPKALEEAVEEGLISPATIAKHASKTARDPYVRAFQK